jgi:hypothetical protein
MVLTASECMWQANLWGQYWATIDTKPAPLYREKIYRRQDQKRALP